ncbi:MAG: efflux RND transporter permease subunit [Bacteroidaceae bacterium]
MNKTILRRPIAVTMCIIAITVMGVLASLRIPVSLMPDIDIPQITVQVSMPGYSAQEIERSVVNPLRGRLMQMAGLTDIRSEARMDAGSVKMTFDAGSNVNLLFIEVNEKVDRAMNHMPRDMERPKVMKASAMDIPAFFLDMTPRDPARFAQMSKFARNVVMKRVEQLPQTAMVDVSGTVGTEIECVPDDEKLRAMGMNMSNIEEAIKRNNITLEALSVVNGIFRYNIHFDSQLITKQDIADIYIHHEGRLIQLKDICTLKERPSSRNGLVRHNGRMGVTMAVIKQTDARMEDLQQSMQELLDDLRKEYPDIDFELTRDQTSLLYYTIENLKDNLTMGALMACLVLLVFMRRWRLSLLVVMSIPLSLIITILCFYLIGISMNIISLSGLILGVGMMVDNAIIVVDNISDASFTNGQPSEKLALWERVALRTREVFTPMLSSVLTTCSVFLPLIFLSGTAGALFYDQAMAVTTALFASLIVATVVVPVYYVLFYRRQTSQGLFSPASRSSWGMRLYECALNWTLRHARLCLVLFAVCIPLTVILALRIDKERMPAVAQDDALLTVNWNSNISAEENDRRVALLMKSLADKVHTSTCMVGTQEFMLAHTKDITASEAVMYLKSPDASTLNMAKRDVYAFLQKHFPQASAEFSSTGNLYDLMFSTDEADLEIHLQNRDGARPLPEESRMFVDTLLSHFPHLDLQPVVTETNLRYVADMEQMALYKVSYTDLYYRLRSLASRNAVLNINEGAQSVPVLVSATGDTPTSIMDATVTNHEGTSVPVSYLVRESRGEDYKRLQAGNGGSFYSVALNAGDREVERVMEFVDSYTHTPGSRFSASYSGGYFSGRKLVGELAVVLAVALALLYFILAAQFESLIQPFIILLEMVIDVFFVLLALWLAGETLNLMSMTGIVVMTGIVINDSILKIDTINRSSHLKSKDNHGLVRAIMEAGHRRLRPIVMTSLTTILALLPFLGKGSMGAAIQYPMSLALVVGMIMGTLVSLFFVPMLYYVIYSPRRK